MGKLSEWCQAQPDWAADAMQRAATSADLTEENITAVVDRVAVAFGMSVEGDRPCLAFDAGTVVSSGARPDDVVLHSVGPIQGLDRLIGGQTLKFALNGVTVIFGENGVGKSGYTRALRHLCTARVSADLQGNVFAEGDEPEKAITFSYQKGDSQPATETWADGSPKPEILSGITMLDTDNLRVYVDGKNDILYLSPEEDCVGRLAQLYRAASGRYRGWIDANTARNTPPYGGHYSQTTTVGRLISRLQIGTPEANLPTEQDLRQAATWNLELETELAQLGVELVQGPAAVAVRYERIAAACANAVASFDAVGGALLSPIIEQDGQLLGAKQRTKQVAETLAAEQIGKQPIQATGSDVWRELYRLARQFAAEAGVRPPDQSFAVGDPCPVCQQAIGEEAARRLAAFDAFVEGAAAREALSATRAVDLRVTVLRNVTFKTDADMQALLREAAEVSSGAGTLVDSVIAFNRSLRARRDERLGQLAAGVVADLVPLPPSPVEPLRTWGAQLAAHAASLRAGDDRTAAITERIAELTDQKQLHGQIEEVVSRQKELWCRHRYLACEAALNTSPLSRLATTLRKELTSPELQTRIGEEIAAFALNHVPLQFADESSRGVSFFEVGLASSKNAKKSRVLSEGEQRALSLACFLAESHVAGRRSAIILDDPVTSLDHARVRRVARRLVNEAAKGRQIIIFTHNLVFYHELMIACLDRHTPVPALPCLIQQGNNGEFGMVSINDEPWVARKVKDRERTLRAEIDAIPDELAITSEEYKRRCTRFYAALRETWERAVEEVVLNDVVRRFGSDVGTLRLGGVEVSDEDFTLIHRAMKRASEHSGHDQAQGRQIDMPTKAQMQADLLELTGFRTTRQKANDDRASRRRGLVAAPPQAEVA